MLFEYRTPSFARKFTRASGHYMATAATPLTAAPLTMACWVWPLDTTNSQDVMSVTDTAASSDAFRLNLGGATAGDPVRAVTSGGGGSSIATVGTYVTNKWQHIAAVFASATSRQAFLNGTGGTVETTSRTPAGIDAMLLGRVGTGASTDYDGYMVWPAVWNVALGVDEMYQLYMGAYPATIRPESLVGFWDFTGREVEHGMKAAYPMVNNGSVVTPGANFLSATGYRPWGSVIGAQESVVSGNRRRRFLIASS